MTPHPLAPDWEMPAWPVEVTPPRPFTAAEESAIDALSLFVVREAAVEVVANAAGALAYPGADPFDVFTTLIEHRADTGVNGPAWSQLPIGQRVLAARRAAECFEDVERAGQKTIRRTK